MTGVVTTTVAAMRSVPPIVPVFGARVWSQSAGLWSAEARRQAVERLSNALEQRTDMRVVALTDSGTSALQLALRLSARLLASGRPAHERAHETAPLCVAVPGFGCIDVATAVQGVDGEALAYDLDPRTLAPNPDSVARALEAGARVVVASHLFGWRFPLAALRAQCAAYGAVLVEDAAQAAGAVFSPFGAPDGDLMILSFGRGKGLGGAGGGALLQRRPQPMSSIDPPLADAAVPAWRSLAVSAATWMLADPRVYAIPAAIPALHLGEMRYHPPTAPRAVNATQATFALSGVEQAVSAATDRTARAARVLRAVTTSVRVTAFDPPSVNTWLRLPVRLRDALDAPPAALGVYRAYPLAVPEQPGTARTVRAVDALTGARELAAHLVTLPVHHRLAERDLGRLERWLAGAA